MMFLSGRSRMKTLDSSLGEKVPLLGPVRCLAMGDGHVAHCCELTVASCAETVDAGGPCVVTSV